MKLFSIAAMTLLILTGCSASTPEIEATSSPSSQLTESQATEDATQPEDSSETEAPADDMPEESQSPENSESTEPQTTTSARPIASASASASAAQTSEPEQSATPTKEPSPSPTPTAEPGFTLSEVSQRNTATNCWVAIDGGVYDLTRWIQSHPGGPGAITSLCGTDGTRQFLGQHGGQSRPSSTLDSYYIGPLR